MMLVRIWTAALSGNVIGIGVAVALANAVLNLLAALSVAILSADGGEGVAEALLTLAMTGALSGMVLPVLAPTTKTPGASDDR